MAVIESISPTSGVPPIGVTLTGTGFASGDTVQADGAAIGTTLVSATELFASLTGPRPAGDLQITVTDAGGAVSNAVTFTVEAPSTPPQTDSYVTIPELETQRATPEMLSQLVGGADYSTKIQRELVAASAMVDGYARARYDIPLQPSEMVKKLVMDIAVYQLEVARGVVRDDDRQAFKDAQQFLRDLSRGVVALDQPAGADPQQASFESKATDDDERVFSDSKIKGF